MDKLILNYYVRYMNILTIAVWTLSLITANLICFKTLVEICISIPAGDLSAEQPLMVPSWHPFDVGTVSGLLTIFAIDFCIMWTGIIFVPSWNTLMIALLTHAIISLRQLNQHLQYVSSQLDAQQVDDAVKRRRRDVETYARLGRCSERLYRIHIYVKHLESLMRPFLFVDFVAFSALICALLYQASQVNADGRERESVDQRLN